MGNASATPSHTPSYAHLTTPILQYLESHSVLNSSAAVSLILGTAALLLLSYWLALPKPLDGIPFNKSAARRVLGDAPALISHITEDKGTFATYLLKTVESLQAPIVQVFIKPLGRPLVVLADFREAQSVLGYRGKDFDRSTSLGDLVRGIGPDHHVLLKTNEAWKSQRRLIQDLMTPSFLNKTAGPAMYHSMTVLLDLWQEKARIADGRPWDARDDINWETLDSVHAFSYGKDFGHSASKPTLEAVRALSAGEIKKIRSTGARDDPVEFPRGKTDELVDATVTLSYTTMEVRGSPWVNLHWAYVMRKPRIRRATKIKETHLVDQIQGALRRLEKTGGKVVNSAVDHMVVRERSLSQKEGRKPAYFSRVMMDELFGFVVAGHDTTSSTMCWAIKHLADYQHAQAKLRDTLRSAYTAASSERRDPSIQDITNIQIPYLDAFLEEAMRCANTVPIVDRQAVVDTELLGHRIPRGTVVSCLVTGPSMTAPPFGIDDALRNDGARTPGQGSRTAWDPSDMAAFKPERWLAGGGRFDPAAGPQLAFGLGTRQCYGKRLAYLKLRIGIVLLVWKFRAMPCPPSLSGHEPMLVMSNEPKDCYICLRKIAPDEK